MEKKYGIHWFRRDLRVCGNHALQANFKENDGKVLGLFCFDEKFLSRQDFSHNRFQYFLETLYSLQKELRLLGSDLLCLGSLPEKSFPQIIKHASPSLITWNRDYEPFARARDKKMVSYFTKEKIPFQHFRDHLFFEPHEITKPDFEHDPYHIDAGYKVYTPFSKKWSTHLKSALGKQRILQEKKSFAYFKTHVEKKGSPFFKLNWKKWGLQQTKLKDNLESMMKKNQKKVTVPIPASGTAETLKKLKELAKKKSFFKSYNKDRDFPALNGTSQFSLLLKNGQVTISQLIAYFDLHLKKDQGSQTFLKELIWREFYFHILYRFPRVEKEAFQLKYRQIKWSQSKKLFEKWKKGETGFPIVDAGMRELNQTGWMHNRVRMIVASFLVKDLLLDWRWGEQYFMEKLLDGDLAANNGGWQWAASTGTDAQPYFRIFNPFSQSKKFDPKGIYIKRYLPELKNLDPKFLHAPIFNHPTYPTPIVDHATQRLKALELFKGK